MLFHWLLHCAIVQNSSKGLETICTWTFATSSFKAASHLREQSGRSLFAVVPRVELAAGGGFPAQSGAQASRNESTWSSLAASTGSHHWSESVSTEEELHFCTFSHWEELSPQLCPTLEPWQFLMLFIKQSALDVAAGSLSVYNAGFSLLGSQCQQCFMSTGSQTLSNLSIFTALLDQSKNHWIPQVLLSCFHLAICLQLGLSQTYKGTVKAKKN